MCMRLSEARVAIVGLGLMGGSLGLALQDRCCARVGVVRRQETVEAARRLGAVDEATTAMADAVRGADVVVLALPVRGIIAAIPEVAAHMKPGALLMDLGSSKREIVEALSAIPEGLLAVGGHPMCGKESSGLENADASLYRGATFALTASARTTPDAMNLAADLARGCGACPLILNVDEHDRAVAITSHLPFLLAAALVNTEATTEEALPVTRRLLAGGFRDMTRLAAGDPTMMLDTLQTNRNEVVLALDAFERQLGEIRRLLDDVDGLSEWMRAARDKRRELFA